MNLFAIKLSDELVAYAETSAKAEYRTLPEQIEYWAILGRAVEDNPDLPTEFIRNTLVSIEEMKQGQLEPYQFG